jgi:hypothetical protein
LETTTARRRLPPLPLLLPLRHLLQRVVVTPADGADPLPVVEDITAVEEEPRAHHVRVATLLRSLRLVMKGGGSSATLVVAAVVVKVVRVVAVAAAAVVAVAPAIVSTATQQQA